MAASRAAKPRREVSAENMILPPLTFVRKVSLPFKAK
jgi:hypothetical protein